jgi:lipase
VTGHGARFARLGERGIPERRWLAPDLRGHGHSTWDAPWHVEQHVADLVETLDTEGIERCTVIGHSFGGLLALALAAGEPQRVSQLVLLDPAVALPGDEMREAAEDVRVDDGWPTAELARAERMAARPQHAKDVVDEDLAAALVEGEDGRFRLRFCRSAVVCAWSEIARPVPSLAGWPGRLLLVPGTLSDYVHPGLRESLAADLGDRFDEQGVGSDHMLYWDAFDELVEVLRPLLVPDTPRANGTSP